MAIKLTTFQKHYILFSKGWYGSRKGDIVPLKKIHAIICGMPVKYVGLNYLWDVIVSIMVDVVQKVHPNIFVRWLEQLPLKKHVVTYQETSFEDKIVDSIGVISTLQIHRDDEGDYVDLGAPDYDMFGEIMDHEELREKLIAARQYSWGNKE